MVKKEALVVHEDDCPIETWKDPSRGNVRWKTLLSGDRTPTSDLTLGVADLDPGEAKDLQSHSHTQPEAYYILSGCGVVRIEGRDHPVKAGSAVYLPGSVEHCAFNTGTEVMRLLYVFPIDSFDEVEYVFPDQ